MRKDKKHIIKSEGIKSESTHNIPSDKENAGDESGRFSVVLDIISSLWVIVVAVIFYGGYYQPDTVGIETGKAIVIYAALIILTAIKFALEYLSKDRNTRTREGAKA